MRRFSPVLAALLLLPLTACNELFGGDEVTVTVTDTANVRDAAKTDGSNVIAKLEAGTELSGEWVETGSGPRDKWLQFDLNGKKAFVWAGNLRESSDSPPAPTPDNTKLDVENLKENWADENGNCRGGSGDNPETQAACNRRAVIGERLAELDWCRGFDSWVSCAEATEEDLSPPEVVLPEFKIKSWTEYDSFMDSDELKFSVQSLEESITVQNIKINKGNCRIIYTLPYLPAKLSYGNSIEGEVISYPKCSIISVEISTDRGDVSYTMR